MTDAQRTRFGLMGTMLKYALAIRITDFPWWVHSFAGWHSHRYPGAGSSNWAKSCLFGVHEEDSRFGCNLFQALGNPFKFRTYFGEHFQLPIPRRLTSASLSPTRLGITFESLLPRSSLLLAWLPCDDFGHTLTCFGRAVLALLLTSCLKTVARTPWTTGKHPSRKVVQPAKQWFLTWFPEV